MTKYKVLIPVFVIMLLAVALIAVLLNNNDNSNENAKFNIVTTFYPVELIVNNIIKDTTNVQNTNISAGVGGCVHDYELNPADMKVLSKANAIVINGQDMEHFIEHISFNDNRIIDSSIDIPNSAISSHIWMDFDNYISQITTISNFLCEKDNANREIYVKNMNEYIGKIENLKMQISKIKSNTNVAIMHDSLKYYEQMGIYTITAELLTGHEGNYSANEIRNFIEQIQKTNTKVLLVDNETYSNSKELVETIQNETSADVVVIDIIVDVKDNLNTYVISMENNINLIKEAVGYVE